MSEVKVFRLEKKIRAADGTFRTLVSFDGVHWAMDEHRQHTRFKRGVQLHKSIAKKAKGRIEAEVFSERKEADPVLLPAWRNNPLMRKKGKRKLRKNRKDGREVKIMRPVHTHLCHGKRFVCCCDFKWKKRKCGGNICLYSLDPKQIIKLIKELRRG